MDAPEFLIERLSKHRTDINEVRSLAAWIEGIAPSNAVSRLASIRIIGATDMYDRLCSLDDGLSDLALLLHGHPEQTDIRERFEEGAEVECCACLAHSCRRTSTH